MYGQTKCGNCVTFDTNEVMQKLSKISLLPFVIDNLFVKRKHRLIKTFNNTWQPVRTENV